MQSLRKLRSPIILSGTAIAPDPAPVNDEGSFVAL